MSYFELLAYSPCLAARAGTAVVTIAANTKYTNVYNTSIYSNGFISATPYVTTTGVFTAEVSGIYHINVCIIIYGPITGSALSSNLIYGFEYGTSAAYTNTSTTYMDQGNTTSSTVIYHVRHSATISLNATDRVHPFIQTGTYGCRIYSISAETGTAGSSILSVFLIARTG